jgi:hypothetical protein
MFSHIFILKNLNDKDHKVNKYLENHSVCRLVGIGTPPSPLPHVNVHLPPDQRRGAHSPAGEGVGESQFQRLKKMLSTLSTQ